MVNISKVGSTIKTFAWRPMQRFVERPQIIDINLKGLHYNPANNIVVNKSTLTQLDRINSLSAKSMVEVSNGISIKKSIISQDIQKKLSNIDLNKCISDVNLLGKGGEAAVYKIPNTNYVLRVHNNSETLESIGNIDLSKGIDFNITPIEEVNDIVGKFNGGEIKKYIEGVSIAEARDPKVYAGINNLSDKNIKEYFSKIIKAKRIGMYHDASCENCLYDINTGKITAIDFWGNKSTLLDSITEITTSKLINKEKLMKKSIKNLLEMVKSGEIKPDELDLTLRHTNWFDDKEFAHKIEQLCKSFNNNKSMNNIDLILKELSNLNEYNIHNKNISILSEISEWEKTLDICKKNLDEKHMERNIKYIQERIMKLKKDLKWRVSESSYIS